MAAEVRPCAAVAGVKRGRASATGLQSCVAVVSAYSAPLLLLPHSRCCYRPLPPRSGISGGQKRRLTCGELLVGGRELLLLDEISTGEELVLSGILCAQSGPK